ncbi:MAG: sulfatase family protein [Pirellulales bacterium]
MKRPTLSVLFLLLPVLLAPGPAAAEERRPNIVVILADDLGYGDVGCYGATKVRTPNIDRLAREGMRFTQAHSPASVCTPSRYNLMTGRYCWRTWAGHGTTWANDPLLIEEGRTTLASLLKEVGYVTGCVGKWHLGFGRPDTPGWDDALGPDFNGELRPGPLDVGFDRFFGMPAVGQHPNIYIDGRRVVGLDPTDPIRFINDPRPSYQVDYLRRPRTAPTNLQMASGKSAELVFENCALRLTDEAVAFLRANHARPFFLYFAPRNIHAPLKPNGRFAGTSAIGVYGDFIHELDWSVGEVLAALDRFGVADNTLVIFSSDNGGVPLRRRESVPAEVAGHRINGPLRGQKTEVFEGGHRVPFIVRWPERVKAGVKSDALVANTDVLATCAEILARPLPHDAGEDSFSFLSALLGASTGHPPRTALVTDSMMGLFAIQEGPWKLIEGKGGGGYFPHGAPPASPSPTEPPGQLYHLGDDLGETRNRYAERPEIVARLSALLEQIRTKERSRP